MRDKFISLIFLKNLYVFGVQWHLARNNNIVFFSGF